MDDVLVQIVQVHFVEGLLERLVSVGGHQESVQFSLQMATEVQSTVHSHHTAYEVQPVAGLCVLTVERIGTVKTDDVERIVLVVQKFVVDLQVVRLAGEIEDGEFADVWHNCTLYIDPQGTVRPMIRLLIRTAAIRGRRLTVRRRVEQIERCEELAVERMQTVRYAELAERFQVANVAVDRAVLSIGVLVVGARRAVRMMRAVRIAVGRMMRLAQIEVGRVVRAQVVAVDAQDTGTVNTIYGRARLRALRAAAVHWRVQTRFA